MAENKLSPFQQTVSDLNNRVEKIMKRINEYVGESDGGSALILHTELEDHRQSLEDVLTDLNSLEEIYDELIDEKKELETEKEELETEKEELETEKEGFEEEIEEKDATILKLEAKEDFIPGIETVQDEYKAIVTKRLTENCSLAQLEHFELMAAKKKGYEYKTGTDPISPELQKAILSKH